MTVSCLREAAESCLFFDGVSTCGSRGKVMVSLHWRIRGRGVSLKVGILALTLMTQAHPSLYPQSGCGVGMPRMRHPCVCGRFVRSTPCRGICSQVVKLLGSVFVFV